MAAKRRGWSYSFIDYRRRYINDRAWFGLAFIAMAVGSLGSSDVPWWVCLPLGTVGVALVVWGVAARR